MLSSTSKPLPAIPKSHPLSNDGRKHRRTVVKALLGLLDVDENDDDGWEDVGEKDTGLVGQLETALDASTDIEHLLLPSTKAAPILYAHRSLVVEEAFMRECGVSLTYPRAKFTPKHSVSSSTSVVLTTPTVDEGSTSSGKRNSFLPTSIISFFSKKSLSRGSSFSIRDYASPRSSLDSPSGYTRQRRFSLLPQLHLTKEVRKREPDIFPVSTSPGVEFPSTSTTDFIRTQAISVLVDSTATETMRYYGKGDIRFKELLRTLDSDRQWVHAGVRVRATITNIEPEPELLTDTGSDSDSLPRTSSQSDQSAADPEPEVILHLPSNNPLTSALSFGKFLELVIYSPRFKAHLDGLGDKIKFKVGSRKEVTFTIERDLRVYALRPPCVQPSTSTSVLDKVPFDDDKHQLRREIRSWWEGVGARLDELEDKMEGAFRKKRLPRIPSEWCDGSDDLSTSPPTSISSSSSSLSAESENLNVPAIRETFHSNEHALYAQLAKCDEDQVNGIRRAFLYAAKNAQGILDGISLKKEQKGADTAKHGASTLKRNHSAESDGNTVKAKENSSTVKGPAATIEHVGFELQEEAESTLPSWWDTSCHIPPKGNIIVREDDWGSIIAYSMSTSEYHAALTSTTSSTEPLLSPSISSITGSSFFSSFRASGSSSTISSNDAKIGDEFSAVISRKENPSQAGMLEVLKDRGSKFGSLRLPGMKKRDLRASENVSGTATPPSSWGKASVDGKTLGSDAGSFKTDMNSIQAEAGSITSGDNCSIYTDGTAESDDTVGPEVPPKDPGALTSEDGHSRQESCPPPTPSKSTLRSALGIERWLFPQISGSGSTNTIDARPHLKYDFTVSQTPRPNDLSSNIRRLKFSCTVYYALSFTTLRTKCALPHAAFLRSISRLEPFKAEGGKSSSGFWRSADGRWLVKTLVSKWGVADLSVLLALSPRYFDWVLRDGGEKGAMVKFMGFYTVEVRNLDTGVGDKVDVLVMENLFSGRKVDRTYDLKGIQGRKVKKKEDKKDKGKDKDKEEKEGEKILETPVPAGVLFDSEWLQGPTTLVTPQSKAILKAAVCADAGWLAQSNIMDYSLLLGVDNEKSEIIGGIVDTIGSYTFAKTLEYNLKANAARKPEEVTVVPPMEYQERFVTAMGKYFTECPDMQSLPELEEGETEWEVPDVL